ncbi:DUF2029 domain-containing protein [Actinospica durhamensis]|uniref:DUF2029 domain-containing protein n=1 Tax=Actinospica durhamensis TaxID=1508375 RepID=A0A941ES21_9ACTN|nr:glycosyltransferase family 87 protein [Actinospica durhamensis]MBR7836455.1 DUF2029 domain-containing protein [Actinospica durhamensis]
MTIRQATPTLAGEKKALHMSPTRRRVVTALTVWFLTRAVLYAAATGHILRRWGVPSVGDVKTYMVWAEKWLVNGHIPIDTKWQYPPLLAPILTFPQWLSDAWGLHYLTTFTVMTVLADAAIVALLLWTAAHRGVWSGPWYWIVGVPLLGPIVYGRYDVFPALFVVFALVLLGKGIPAALADDSGDTRSRRKRWLAGILIGFGAAVKIWPGLAIFGMPRTRRGWETILAVAASVVGVIALLSLFYTHTLSFIGNQSGRGIEIESIWGVLFLLGKRLGLEHVKVKLVYGSYQTLPDSHAMHILVSLAYYASMASTVLGFGLLAYWWWRKTWRPAMVADATFVATLMMIVVSRVISPQYMIWALAVAGFCLLYKDTTQRRSALLVLIALPLTQYEFPFFFQQLLHAHLVPVLVVLLRDLLLIAATVIGFRDMWVSSVEGGFLPRRLSARLGRTAAQGAPATDAADADPHGTAVGTQRPAPANEAETQSPSAVEPAAQT